LKEDAELLSAQERTPYRQRHRALQAAVMGDDRRAIDQAMDALSKGTNEFAARRMNKSVSKALSGKKIDQ
jgi:molecular chaperone HscA